MIFPQLARFTDLALLLLRIMVGIVFLTSGWNPLHDPERRSHDIEMSKGFTIFLGLAELAGSLGVVFGIFVQPAAIGLILIMLGAQQGYEVSEFVWEEMQAAEKSPVAAKASPTPTSGKRTPNN